jgi:DNA topoisomerase-1
MTRIEKLMAKGIHRKGSAARGFRYVTADGRKIGRADSTRIEALKIPPAWADVCINPSPSGAVQAIGKDVAGRWQYLYHESRVRHRERRKYQRLVEFGEKLPAMRKAMARDIRQPGYPRDRVLAGILRILSKSFIRPGSEVYASENGSYGIATLRPKHVKVKSDLVIFDFPGKSGVRHQSELRDRTTARIVKELLRQPGRDVFKYQNGDGLFVDVKRRHINAYIKEIMGANFSAKDFRTWFGTLICASALARVRADLNGNRRANKRLLVAAVKETAAALGNTPAVCRSSYICPLIMSSFEKGKVIDRHFVSVKELMAFRGTSLHPAERSLLRFLRQSNSR